MLTLKPSDKVALIAPASGQKTGQENLITTALKRLDDWGVRVVQHPVLAPPVKPMQYLASSDSARTQSLLAALTAPDIKAIFVTRGGYGCARLIPYLNAVVVPSPRFLVGFSDVTTLHLHFSATKNLHCVHAVNLATQQFLAETKDAKKNREALHDCLFNGKTSSLLLSRLSDGKSIEKPILPNVPMTGGCLSLLVASLGTSYELDTAGKVLMIEEVGETPYKLDRLLTQLKLAGKFAEVEAVIIGSLSHCDSAGILAEDVVREIFSDVNSPVYCSPTFGHGTLNLPWHYSQFRSESGR